MLNDSEVNTLLMGSLLSFKMLFIMFNTLCGGLYDRWGRYCKVFCILSIGIRIYWSCLIVLIRWCFYAFKVNKLYGFSIGIVGWIFDIIFSFEFHRYRVFDLDGLLMIWIGRLDGFIPFFMVISEEGIFLSSFSLHSYIY